MPLSQSPVNRGLIAGTQPEDSANRARPTTRSKRYGGKFASGFLEFYKQSELADCTVVGPDGCEYRLHSLLLAYHSEFFRRALSSEFRECAARRIELGFEDAGDIWPLLIEYFYTEEITLTDSNVLALFAASRELLIPAIQDYCSDFTQSSLEASNAIQFLSQAVQYNCEQFRASCVALVAQSFNTCCGKPTDGLPVEVMLEILEHPQLYVQTEEQVLLFVLNYVRRHRLDDATVRTLFRAVRLPFLSNDRLAALALAAEEYGNAGGGGLQGPPADMLLAAMAQRLQLLDHPERLQPPPTAAAFVTQATTSTSATTAAAGGGGGGDGRSASSLPSGSSVASFCGDVTATAGGGGSGSASGTAGQHLVRTLAAALAAGGPVVGGGGGSAAASSSSAAAAAAALSVVPRKTYCCSVEYGLPGGSEYVSVPMEAVWEELASNLAVRVSGDQVEGDPDSVLRTGSDDTASWFTVSGDDPSHPVWVEVVFPPHMRVVEFSKYTFSHGMNMIAHMFPYGISDSSWFQMKGMCTQVSPGDEESLTPLRTQDSCQQHTEFVVSVDPAHTRAVVWRRLRIVAGEDNTQQVRLSIRKLKLYGRVEVSLMRESEGRDVVAAWRRRKEAAAAAGGGRQYQGPAGSSFKRALIPG
ncbi:hypothetical protein Agub_g12861 [Astrephomene gubernaculifera]|uniref:BTB domain-containing protein n=1 Tax=Astrephomene gubernaculifera TaxID=47775 RepID=A0AAD3HRV9_9CHLO|nr:hypothetical protein Agub_g12861 [Astrephomene gubernaculifera]